MSKNRLNFIPLNDNHLDLIHGFVEQAKIFNLKNGVSLKSLKWDQSRFFGITYNNKLIAVTSGKPFTELNNVTYRVAHRGINLPCYRFKNVKAGLNNLNLHEPGFCIGIKEQIKLGLQLNYSKFAFTTNGDNLRTDTIVNYMVKKNPSLYEHKEKIFLLGLEQTIFYINPIEWLRVYDSVTIADFNIRYIQK